MATLNSPGVAVTVSDESMYAPSAPGTVPLIVIATAEDKLTGSSVIAPGTQKSNYGKVYLNTSQKDLVDTFGDAVFKVDAESHPIHGSEQNEYGLQAAYSYLGASNAAFIARADIDLSQLEGSSSAPTSYPENNTYWFDCNSSSYGIFEWNGSPLTSTNGQSYINKLPLIITEQADVANFAGGDYSPKSGKGVIGDYAIVTVTTSNELYYKNRDAQWVVVGSNQWSKSWPTVVGSKVVTTSTPLTVGDDLVINNVPVTVAAGSNTLQGLANAIISANIPAITAAVINNKLEIYNDGSSSDSYGDTVVIASGTQGTLVTASANDSTNVLGIATGTYFNPKLTISKHTQLPDYKAKGNSPRPSGSLWIKTTTPNLGANWRVKVFQDSTKSWTSIPAPLFANNQSALFEMDRAGGGFNIPLGNVFVNYNFDENTGLDSTPLAADFRLMKRNGVGETIITSKQIKTGTLTARSYTLTISESILGSAVLSDYSFTGTSAPVLIQVNATGTVDDANNIVSAINSSALVNVSAFVNSLNQVVIKHKLGGDFRLLDGPEQILTLIGFSAYNLTTKTGTANLYTAPLNDTTPVQIGVDLNGDPVYVHKNDFVASLWVPLTYSATISAPTSLAQDGRLWYSNVLNEIDIMIHDGHHWVGYQTTTSPYYSFFDNDKTDPNGPIIAASIPPVTQSDGTPLVTGDLWIDTGDIENFPRIYKFNAEFELKPIKNRWVLIDNTDQTTEEGIVFGDARFNISGDISDTEGSIVDLLQSNFVDFDAPDPALYPKGMLLWNTRRSGFNVKKFVYNYVDPTAENARYGAAPLYYGESMVSYYPHRWVTISDNQEDGSGTFGRHAQRKVVVRALQALVNSNQDIRDEEGRVFNLIACPGYPELIGEMVSLNVDRGLTAFVVGDTPARLPSDATSLLAWGNNTRLALEDNDYGAATSDPYMAMFYPWGYTSDNAGNNIVVPPSHMMLKTIALSDNASYPWFAPAGTARGTISNASSVGYITSEGEFKAVALTTGQRDTLYEVRINPITFFSGSGLMNYGQKTRAPVPSSIDRINVARLVVYLRRRLPLLAKPFLFQPNDRTTRNELKAVIESVMLELVGTRAISDYLVVVDDTNNTPARIDKNELYADIAIVPVKAVEFIYIPLRLKNTGAITSGG